MIHVAGPIDQSHLRGPRNCSNTIKKKNNIVYFYEFIRSHLMESIGWFNNATNKS